MTQSEFLNRTRKKLAKSKIHKKKKLIGLADAEALLKKQSTQENKNRVQDIVNSWKMMIKTEEELINSYKDTIKTFSKK